MIFFLLAEIELCVAKTYVRKIIFEGRGNVLFPLDVVAFRFLNEKRVQQVVDIGADGFIRYADAITAESTRQFRRIGQGTDGRS